LKATAVSLDGTKKRETHSFGEKSFWKATTWMTK